MVWKTKALLYFDRLTAHQLAIFFPQCARLCICIHIRRPPPRTRYRYTSITQQKSPKFNTLLNHFSVGGQCKGYLWMEMAWIKGKAGKVSWNGTTLGESGFKTWLSTPSSVNTGEHQQADNLKVQHSKPQPCCLMSLEVNTDFEYIYTIQA